MPEDGSRIDISLFFRINEEITPSKNLNELYNSIVRITRDLTGSESVSLLLYNKSDDKLYIRETIPDDTVLPEGELSSVDEGVGMQVFRGMETVVINNSGTDNPHSVSAVCSGGSQFRNLICTPMKARGEPVGVLEAVNSPHTGGYTPSERNVIEMIAMISAAAITHRLLYEDLKKRVEELDALYELSNAAVIAADENEFFHRVLGILAGSLNVERASLVFYFRERKQLEVVASYGSYIPEGTVVKDDSIAAYVFRTGKAMNVRNILTDLPDSVSKVNGAYKSDAFVSIPLFYSGNIVGVLNLTDKKNRRLFDEFEMHVLTSLINHVTGIYRNYADRRSEEKRKKLRQEIKIASEIQRKNLTRIPRKTGGLSIALLYEPAREVGGDFFDFYDISKSFSAFLIADVSGKGIPAALFTGTVKNILRAEQRTSYDPVSLFTRANRLIYCESEYGMFVTAFYVIIDENGGNIFFSSAGHNEQMLVRRKGGIVPLKTSGKPLGVVDNVCYSAGAAEFNKGDMLLLFTDGLAEALGGDDMDIDNGFRRLGDIVMENIDRDCEHILNNIRNAVRESSMDVELADDLTILAISL